MKNINRRQIRKMILKEMNDMGSGVGSFYSTQHGAMWDKLLGIQGLMDELQAVSARLRYIRDIALRCQSGTQEQDTVGGGYVDDQHGFDFYQNIIDRCDMIMNELNYQNFLL